MRPLQTLSLSILCVLVVGCRERNVTSANQVFAVANDARVVHEALMRSVASHGRYPSSLPELLAEESGVVKAQLDQILQKYPAVVYRPPLPEEAAPPPVIFFPTGVDGAEWVCVRADGEIFSRRDPPEPSRM